MLETELFSPLESGDEHPVSRGCLRVLARFSNWQLSRLGGKSQGFEIIPIWAEIPNSAGMRSVRLWMCD